jgi:hypothetical protein
MDDMRLKLDKIADDITEIKINTAGISATLVAQKDSLDHHILRTDTLQEQVGILKSEVDKAKGVKDFVIFFAKVSSVLIAFFALIKKFF